MTTLSRLALVLSAAFLALGLTAENDADPKVALKKAELGMESAVKANDGDKFSEFLAPDWKLVGDGGDVMEKDAIIQAMKAGEIEVYELQGRRNGRARLWGCGGGHRHR